MEPGGLSSVLSGYPEDKAQDNFTDPQSRIMKMGGSFEQCYNAQAVVDADSQLIVAIGLGQQRGGQRATWCRWSDAVKQTISAFCRRASWAMRGFAPKMVLRNWRNAKV